MGYKAFLIGTAILWCIGALYTSPKKVAETIGVLLIILLSIFLFYFLIGGNYADVFTLKTWSRSATGVALLYGSIFGAICGLTINITYRSLKGEKGL